jgi:glycosyltransferase involved in cell wall biosynthesis
LSRKKHLIFAEQFYYPEGWGGAQIPRDITMELAQNGWIVDVICGSDPYAPVTGETSDPRTVGVRIRRVRRLLGGGIHSNKFLKQLWYYALSVPFLVRLRPEIYVSQTNPPLILPLIALASWWRRRPLVIIAQDLYPEVMFAHGMLKTTGVRSRLLQSVFRWSYRRAHRVISLGPCMTERLVRKGVAPQKIAEICNWATGEAIVVKGPENRLRDSWGLSGKFVVLYSGNVGIAHDVATPIAAVAAAQAQMPNMVLVFIGQGPRLAEARALAAQLNIEHAVQFRPFVSSELLPHTLGLADVALVTLRKGFEGLVVPSKLLGHLARAVPTIYIGPESDVSHLLRQSGGGRCFPNDMPAMLLAHELVELAVRPERLEQMGAAGQRYYERELAKDIALARYRHTLQQLFDAVTKSEAAG